MDALRRSRSSSKTTLVHGVENDRSADRLLLTVEEAAFRCSVSRSTMYSLVGAGLIQSIVVGVRSRRVVAADLERWIAEQTS